MGDVNPIRTIGDYSKPSHEGYMNTIELPVGKNVVSLRSDTIRLVLNGCSFHRLRSEDPNQHLKDFLKLVDSLDLDDFSTASPQKDDDEITLAETLVNIKKSTVKDKGKSIMQESEPPKKIKKKEMIQISLNEEIAQRFYEEEKAQLLKDKEYAQQADEDLPQRMLEEERESLSIKERSRLLTEFINQRKKMLAAKRDEEKRNKPHTQAQQRTYMSNYIKNMDSKAGEGSSKEGESLKRHAEEELGHEQQKKQKVKEDLSQERLQQMMVIIPEHGIHVEALQTKRTPKIDLHAGRKTKKVKCLEESSEYRRFNSTSLKIWREITILGEDWLSTMDLHDKGVIDSGCSRHITRNMSYLIDYEEIDEGYIAFGGNPKEGKSLEKADEGFFVDYSLNSKAFRVFNNRTRIVEENLHIRFSDNTPNIARSGPNWLFDIDALTKSMNYKPVVAGNQSNSNACTEACDDAGKTRMETVPRKDYIVLPLWTVDLLIYQESKSSQDDEFQPSSDDGKKVDEDPRQESKCKDQEKDDNMNSTNKVNVAGIYKVNVVCANTNNEHPFDPEMPALGDINTFNFLNDHEDDDEMADMNNLDTTIHNKKDERGILIINKARLVAQRHTQEEGIDYDEVFAPVARIKAIRLFLAYASFKDFVVYQIDVKSAFLYGKIKKELYVCQPLGFEDLDFLDKVYKVEKALYGLRQAPRAWHETLSTQDKYVAEILKKYGFTKVKNESTPMETQKPMLKDEDGEEVDVHVYRSMIGSLMYLTSSKPDIMFGVCACAIYQVNPKVSHLHAVKGFLGVLLPFHYAHLLVAFEPTSSEVLLLTMDTPFLVA
nr:putative reverse transcriptase, RNA-dependent DNA polymerase [Tanacetum cinerariifolium]